MPPLLVVFPAIRSMPGAEPSNLDVISMNIQEENSACYFRVQSECEQTLICMIYLLASLVTGAGRLWLARHFY